MKILQFEVNFRIVSGVVVAVIKFHQRRANGSVGNIVRIISAKFQNNMLSTQNEASKANLNVDKRMSKLPQFMNYAHTGVKLGPCT